MVAAAALAAAAARGKPQGVGRAQGRAMRKGTRPYKNCLRHIDVSHSRQPLVKGERLMRTERKTATDASPRALGFADTWLATYPIARCGNATKAATESLGRGNAARVARRHVRPKPT